MNHSSDQIFTAESSFRTPRRLFTNIWADLGAARQLAWHIFVRDIQVRYRESYLGILWAFVPPIALTLGFSIAARANIVNVGTTEVPYPVFVGLGTILWQLFVEAINAPIAAMNGARSMITKIRFPREALFIAKAGEVLFNFLIKAILFVALLAYYEISPGPMLWAVPIAIFALLAFGTMIGILLVPMSVIFQDVVHGVTLMTTYWFFITPIAYQTPPSGILNTIVSLNPVTPFLVTARELAISSSFTYLNEWMILAPFTIGGLILSWIVLYVSMPILIERING